MYALAGILATFIMVPWLFICLTPFILILGSAILVIAAFMRFVLHKDLGIVGSLGFAGEIAKTPGKSVKQKVLVVDDDFASVMPLIGLLENGNTDVNFVSSGTEMIQKLKAGVYDLIFLDSKMPNMSGQVALEMGDQILSLEKKQPVIFFSSFASHLDVPGELKHFEVRDMWRKSDLATLQRNVTELFSSSATEIVA